MEPGRGRKRERPVWASLLLCVEDEANQPPQHAAVVDAVLRQFVRP